MIKRIDVIIATRNRLEKLYQTIDSIPGNNFGIETYIKICCDGDYKSFLDLTSNPRLSDLIFVNRHSGAVHCRNILARKCTDAIIYATDDIIFDVGSIKEAIKMFMDKFSDSDGVIGFNQTGNNRFNPAGVGLMGKKFLSRYPDNKLFYPGYFHFACQEIYWTAKKLNKFYLCDTAIVNHLNPFVEKKYMDQTHADARLHKIKDHLLIEERKEKGLMWGINE